MDTSRQAEVVRATAETDIRVKLNLDGTGASRIDTGVPFLDHMLTLFARHGFFDLEVTAKGDLAVEYRCTGQPKGYAVTAKLTAPDGSEAGKGGSCAWDGRFSIPVERPALWSGEFPNLYTLELWVVRESDNAVVEYCRTKSIKRLNRLPCTLLSCCCLLMALA